MKNINGAATAVPPGPQGSPAAKPGSQAQNAKADEDQFGQDLLKSVLAELPPDSDPAPDGDPEEQDPVLSQDQSEEGSPETPEGADGEEGDEPEAPAPTTVPIKRLNKEVARRKALETDLATLKSEVEALKSGKAATKATPAGDPWSPLARDEAYQQGQKVVAEAQAEIAAANQLLDQLDDDPEAVAEKMRRVGYKIPQGASERTIAGMLQRVIQASTTESADARAELKAKERDYAAKAAQERAAWEPITAGEFPWIEDDEDPRSAMAANLIKHNPWLDKIPTGRFALGAVVEKLHALQLRNSKGANKPGQKPGVPKVRPGASGGAGTGSRPVSASRGQAARQAFQENPSEGSLVGAILADLEGE